jgi:hypothetical protein
LANALLMSRIWSSSADQQFEFCVRAGSEPGSPLQRRLHVGGGVYNSQNAREFLHLCV